MKARLIAGFLCLYGLACSAQIRLKLFPHLFPRISDVFPRWCRDALRGHFNGADKSVFRGNNLAYVTAETIAIQGMQRLFPRSITVPTLRAESVGTFHE